MAENHLKACDVENKPKHGVLLCAVSLIMSVTEVTEAIFLQDHKCHISCSQLSLATLTHYTPSGQAPGQVTELSSGFEGNPTPPPPSPPPLPPTWTAGVTTRDNF